MKLFPKTLIVIITVLVGMMLVLNTVIYDTVGDRFRDAEEDAISKDMDRVDSMISREMSQQLIQARDNAHWTALCDYMLAPNGTFLQENFVDSTLQYLNLNFMLLYDVDGMFIEGQAFSFETLDLVPLSPELLEYLNDTPDMITHLDTLDDHQMFVKVGDQVALLTSTPILTTDEEGPIMGSMLSGVYIDDIQIERISSLASVNLTAVVTTGDDLPEDIVNTIADPSFIITGRSYAVLSSDMIAMYSPLFDSEGNLLMVLGVSNDRSIYEDGMTGFTYINLFLVAIMMVFGLILTLFFNAQMVGPISKLNDKMRTIGNSGDLSARVERSPYDDEVAELIVSFNDMLEQLELKDKGLKVSEQRYRDLVESSTDWIWQTDGDWKLTFNNAITTSLLGFAIEELNGRIFFDLLDDGERKIIEGRLRMASETAAPVSEDIVTMVSKNGRRVQFEMDAQPIFDAGGSWLGYRGIARDITYRVRGEKALEKTNRQLNLLSSITRHDILNQASILSGYGHLLREMTDDPTLLQYLGKQQKAIDTIERQIKFTSIYHQLGTQEPLWNDIPRILNTITRHLDPHDLKITVRVGPSEVFADPMLEKAFFNLIDNTMRHSKATEMTISDMEKDGALVIVFEDNGNGVPADHKESIFDRGFGQNTGLGLFLVREILAITNITIIENGVPGSGARFEVIVHRGQWRKHVQGQERSS